MKKTFLKRIVLAFAFVSVLALGACTTENNANADQLNETISAQITTINQVIEHTNSKHEWMNSDDTSDETVVEGINDSIFEMEAGRIRVDTQLRALNEGSIVINREKVSVASLLSDHEELVQSIWLQWSDLSAELVYMANDPVLSDAYEESLEKANDKAAELVESLTTLLDSLGA
jgi:hypothetical protein